MSTVSDRSDRSDGAPGRPGSARAYEPYEGEKLERLVRDAEVAKARYPDPRSALLPLLHLVQSEDGYVSPDGIAFCAGALALSTAEVSAVATFYSQYKRRPNGEYTVGVCTNTLCAVMGGDAIFEELSEHLGIGHDETTEDGTITLERVECNAACDYAPVMMVNWEFFDNQTPDSAKQVTDRLRAGEAVAPTRGADSVCGFKQMSRVLAGFSDGRADEGVGAGPATLAGWRLAQEKGWEAPSDSAAGGGGEPSVEPTPSTPEPVAEQVPASTGTGEEYSSVDQPAAPPTGGTADTDTGREADDVDTSTGPDEEAR